MDNSSSIFNFRRWPWAVLLTLGVLLCAEGLARYYAPRIRSFSDKTILYKKAWLERADGHAWNGLIIGDSRVLGVDAGVMERVLSRQLSRETKVYNLSLPGSGVQSYYLLLKKYLRHHPPPEWIVFSVAPVSWTGTENFIHDEAPISTGLHRFCLMFSVQDAWEVFPRRFFLKALRAKVERMSLLITYRRMIRDFLEQGGRSYQPEPSLEDLTQGRSGGINYAAGGVPEFSAIRQAVEYRMDFIPDGETVVWYERFLRLAQEHGIRVVIADAPQITELYDHLADNGTQACYTAFMRGLAGRFRQVAILEPLLEGYDRSLFRDTQHLNGDGFRRFSPELAQRLGAWLARP